MCISPRSSFHPPVDVPLITSPSRYAYHIANSFLFSFFYFRCYPPILVFFFFFLMTRPPRRSPLFPYPPLSRSRGATTAPGGGGRGAPPPGGRCIVCGGAAPGEPPLRVPPRRGVYPRGCFAGRRTRDEDAPP